jgi:hypothetical protein
LVIYSKPFLAIGSNGKPKIAPKKYTGQKIIHKPISNLRRTEENKNGKSLGPKNIAKRPISKRVKRGPLSSLGKLEIGRREVSISI